MSDGCHSHGGHGHGHSHGPGGHGFGGMGHGFMPGLPGQFAQRGEAMTDPTQQPKKRSHMDDSSSWDIVKATQ